MKKLCKETLLRVSDMHLLHLLLQLLIPAAGTFSLCPDVDYCEQDAHEMAIKLVIFQRIHLVTSLSPSFSSSDWPLAPRLVLLSELQVIRPASSCPAGRDCSVLSLSTGTLT